MRPETFLEVAVTSEETPNPNAMMFRPVKFSVLGPGSRSRRFGDEGDARESPLAGELLRVEGVRDIMLAGDHITITKTTTADWEVVEPIVNHVISSFFASGMPVVREDTIQAEASGTHEFESGSIEARIIELIEERVKPFVQEDGGDVSFHRFDHDDGTLYLEMHGACVGCSKQNITLGLGIKNLVGFHIPEVKWVEALEEDDAHHSKELF